MEGTIAVAAFVVVVYGYLTTTGMQKDDYYTQNIIFSLLVSIAALIVMVIIRIT